LSPVPDGAKSKKLNSTSGRWKLDNVGQMHLEKGMQMIGMPSKSPVPTVSPEPEVPPSEDESVEVRKATDKLAGIVDQMVPSFLMSLGLLDSALKWLRVLAVGMSLGVLFGAFVAFRMQDAASKSEKAAEDSAKAVKELGEANKEIRELKSSLQSVMKEVMKVKGLSQIESQTSIQITAGDKPGEVNILAPQVSRAEIEKAKSKVEDAVEAGRPLPPPPSPYITAKIPAQLKRVETTLGPIVGPKGEILEQVAATATAAAMDAIQAPAAPKPAAPPMAAPAEAPGAPAAR
jgi:hypothetical protein